MTTALLANSLTITGATSGTTTLDVTATTSGTLTLPAGAGTVTVAGVNSNIVQGTAANTTSGTAVGFTGIPSWVRKITLMLNQVSTNGTADLLVQIGSGSYTTTGYESEGALVSTAGLGLLRTSTSGFIVPRQQTAATACSGIITLCLIGPGLSAGIWVMTGYTTSQGGTAGAGTSAGAVNLGGTLDRIQLTSVTPDTFDAGSINILYE